MYFRDMLSSKYLVFLDSKHLLENLLYILRLALEPMDVLLIFFKKSEKLGSNFGPRETASPIFKISEMTTSLVLVNSHKTVHGNDARQILTNGIVLF